MDHEHRKTVLFLLFLQRLFLLYQIEEGAGEQTSSKNGVIQNSTPLLMTFYGILNRLTAILTRSDDLLFSVCVQMWSIPLLMKVLTVRGVIQERASSMWETPSGFSEVFEVSMIAESRDKKTFGKAEEGKAEE